ncbi:GGDEF domain-containing protein [Catenovulum sp. SM1970]|uniref:GGDEF domain-containing protein n=1 Tax=Marinifaba aquimaris TaxID=2741323 RepID=UPI0015739F4F|nr:GGDEF domain-containing protein [Marinifaba aquimaris]NTS77875.1 GGDEF domain-containing protein [Marinifaba aquimaris]
MLKSRYALTYFTIWLSVVLCSFSSTAEPENWQEREQSLASLSGETQQSSLLTLLKHYKVYAPSKTITLASQFADRQSQLHWLIQAQVAEAFMHYGDLKEAKDIVAKTMHNMPNEGFDKARFELSKLAAQINMLLGDNEQALKQFQRLLSQSSAIKHGQIINEMAKLYILEYRLADAMAVLFPVFNQLDLSYQARIDATESELESLLLIADLLTQLRQYTIAHELYQILKVKLASFDNSYLALKTELGLVVTTNYLGQQQLALTGLDEILTKAKSVESLLVQANIYQQASQVYLYQNQLALAEQWVNQTANLLKIIQVPYLQRLNELTQVELIITLGNIRTAENLLAQSATQLANIDNPLLSSKQLYLSSLIALEDGELTAAQNNKAQSEQLIKNIVQENTKTMLDLQVGQIYIATLERKLETAEQGIAKAQTTNQLFYISVGLILSLLVLVIFQHKNWHKIKESLIAENNQFEDKLNQLKHVIRIDPVTQVFNRQHMDEVLKQESHRHDINHRPLCLVLIDIDQFHQLSQAHSQAGIDVCSQELAAIIQKHIRAHDILSRWGNKEFLLLLPELRLEGAKHICESIRVNVERESISFHGQVLNFTISAGVAQYEAGDDIHEVLALADEALYQARKNGQNSIYAHHN